MVYARSRGPLVRATFLSDLVFRWLGAFLLGNHLHLMLAFYRKEKLKSLVGLLGLVACLIAGGLYLGYRDRAFYEGVFRNLPLPNGLEEIYDSYSLRARVFFKIYKMNLPKDVKPKDVYLQLEASLTKNGWQPVSKTAINPMEMIWGKKARRGKNGERFQVPYMPDSYEEYARGKPVLVYVIPFMVKNIEGETVLLYSRIWEDEGKTLVGIDLSLPSSGKWACFDNEGK